MKTKSVLVTGASGFIGRALTGTLVDHGYAVTTVSRSGSMSGSGSVHCVIPDADFAWADVLPQLKYDWVIHLAAAGVNPNDRDGSDLIAANIRLGASLIAEVDADVFVHIGSCAEYADRGAIALTESDMLQYRDSYGLSKAAGGLLHLDVAKKLKKKLALLRLFHVYGPGEMPHRLTTRLFDDLQAGDRVPLSHGEQKRDFVFVDDVVTAILSAAEGLEMSQVSTGAYNVCTGVPTTVKAVCEHVADILGVPQSLLGFGDLPLRANEIDYLVGNPESFMQASGWSPQYNLEQGLQKIWDQKSRMQ